jgi:hypothetical protein
MANLITAGNSTNNGLAVTSDNTGALNILTGSGAGTAAISIDGSQNVTAAANLAVTGNVTVTGTLSATNGITGSLKSATAQASTSGTSIDFTSIPSGVKRITVMFNGVSTSGTSNIQIQLGDSGGVEITGYSSAAVQLQNSGTGNTLTTATSGFIVTGANSAASVFNGVNTFCLLGSNTWTGNGGLYNTAGVVNTGSGAKTLSDVLDRVRITTVNGTDTFDAGSINIIYE